MRAKLCQVCGYFHEGEAATVDLCEHCGTRLDGNTSTVVTRLFEMTTVATQRADRITCDEEERVREGYEVTTHFRFAPASGVGGHPSAQGGRRLRASIEDPAGHPLLELTHAPAATLWRINHKWRRAIQDGYVFDPARGIWGRRPQADEDGMLDAGQQQVQTGVRVLVHDTRNILLVRPPGAIKFDNNLSVALQHALQRGIEAVFQVEESELASECIGGGDQRSILLWEAAEGGAGVLVRLVEDGGAMANVAREALRICHFDPETGEDLRAGDDGCARACYDCLLSYSNQRDHLSLNRHAICDLLMRLACGVTHLGHRARSYEEQYTWLRQLTDRRSDVERYFLDHLYRTNRRLPDYAQRELTDYPCRPDFFYDAGMVTVFCDGSVHDTPEQQAEDRRIRGALVDMGYRVVVIRYDADLEAQVCRCPDVFGEGTA